MSDDIRDIVDDIRAAGITSIEGITAELNRRGFLVDGEPWSEARVASLMWMLDSTGTTHKNPGKRQD